MYAVGENVERNQEKAIDLCRQIAMDGHINGALLLGELLVTSGQRAEGVDWWKKASDHGSERAKTLLEIATWRWEKPIPGQRRFIESDHFYQGWNNCGATSIAMLARHFGGQPTPYDVKRLCLENPIGVGTDWEDLVSTCKTYHQKWKMITFSMDDAGFNQGVAFIQSELDVGRPVVIDFTITFRSNGKERKGGHTLTVGGYNKELDQFLLRNPNQPPPGLQLISTNELKEKWYSDGYSRLSNGVTSRPLIVVDSQ